MRIVFVLDYSLEHIGGTMTSLSEQCQALTSAGHHVVLLALGKTKPTNANIAISPGSVVMVKPSLTFGKLTYHLPVVFNTKNNRKRLSDIFDQLQPDIVHIQSEFSLAIMTVWEARRRNIPTVSTIHTFFWTSRGYRLEKILSAIIYILILLATKTKLENLPNIQGNSLEKTLKSITLTLANQVDFVISPSAHQAKTMQKAGLTTPVTTLVNPYNPPENSPKPRLISKKQPLRLVWIGRIDLEKRLDIFLEAVALARQIAKKPIVVDIIGDGPQAYYLQTNFKHSDTTFHGHIPHGSIVDKIDQSHALVVSSYHFDNQPMVIAEAITRWRPIIYCDERLTEGTSFAGYLVPSPDKKAWATSLVEIAEQPEILANLSHAASQQADFFSRDNYASKILPIYGSLLS